MTIDGRLLYTSIRRTPIEGKGKILFHWCLFTGIFPYANHFVYDSSIWSVNVGGGRIHAIIDV